MLAYVEVIIFYLFFLLFTTPFVLPSFHTNYVIR